MPIFYKPKRKVSKKEQSAARLENFRKEVSTDSHIIPLEELCERLETDPDTGLTQNQASDVLLRTGPNVLTPSRKKSELAKFMRTLFHGFSALLWIGAGLCFLSVLINYYGTRLVDMDNLVLGCVLIVVVVVTGAFMYYQERKSQNIMESFCNMVPAKATVIRDGIVKDIACKEVVLGDLVEIKFGDRVPADLRIIHCQNLKVDNSPLTGETEAQPRSSSYSDDNFLEARNVAFFSTDVIEGTGRGIVIACGDQTVMGHIAGLTARLAANKTPMARELERFMKIISVWAICLGLMLGLALLLLGRTVLQTLLFSIGIIVANVPEGLLATVIVCLTVTAKRMASENCVVKKLETVETLGCSSVVCTDKTGTLTQNRMTVCHLWFNGKVIEVDYNNINKLPEATDKDFRNLIRCATLCNRAEFFTDQKDVPILQRKVRGDASEGAILKLIETVNLLGAAFRDQNPKLVEIPFSSTTKYQSSVHALEGSTFLIAMKGAPEVILDRCSQILHRNETKPMTPKLLNTCNNACLNFAEMGERVLAFCDLKLDDDYPPNFRFTTEPTNFPQRGLRFLGLIALIDPPRPQVPDAIKKCKDAGIRVVMVTGDHPVTAKAIAIKVGIITEQKVLEFNTIKMLRNKSTVISKLDRVSSVNLTPAAVVIHGEVLRNLLEDELDNLLSNHKEIVFARTSPTQKLQIVEGFQRLGEIVAVTGDGVNDAPALKRADTGIAMGIVGTEVSQQAADIILMDDNFASIIIGIEEGRRIFDNLKKSITYTLASNVPEILPFLGYAFLGFPLPLGVIAILCIDLLTDMMPAISLAYENAETDIMSRPPRNPLRDRLVNRKLYFLAYGNLGMIEAVGAFCVYFLVMAEHGFMPSTIIGIREEWESKSANVSDFYERTWTHPQRRFLEETCYTACMMSVVVSQWTNLVACKTRYNSITKQGMGNHILNASLVVETVLTCILAYTPYMHYLQFFPLSWRWWLYALPCAILLLCYDEFRKWHIRKYPKGWYQRETYY